MQLQLSHFSLHEALQGDFSVWMFIRPLLAKYAIYPVGEGKLLGDRSSY